MALKELMIIVGEHVYIDQLLFTCTVLHFVYVLFHRWVKCKLERWLSIKLLQPHVGITWAAANVGKTCWTTVHTLHVHLSEIQCRTKLYM